MGVNEKGVISKGTVGFPVSSFATLVKTQKGCSTYNGLYGEVWLPLENKIFCSGFRYEWVGISPVEAY